MRLLLVTEKSCPTESQRDGGARLVDSLQRCFGETIDILQFDIRSNGADESSAWRHIYPEVRADRFTRRIANSAFVADRVRAVAGDYTHVLFVHASMGFGLCDPPLQGVRTWLFPMFLSPSYIASGEVVPQEYRELERRTLNVMDRILTPSHLERQQIIDEYGVTADRVRVVPRGVERNFLAPSARSLQGAPQFCSVGSIKRQKNTLGLIRLFDTIRQHYPGAKLRIIGPIQDQAYAAEVRDEVCSRSLLDAVEFHGHTPPDRLALVLEDVHIHLSASCCETFGRAIFETLASGIPNIVPLHLNAAAEYLQGAPYIHFFRTPDEILPALEAILKNYEQLSELAMEVGGLYEDDSLRQILGAELRQAEILAVSDYDGTLYHRNDSEKTTCSVAAFRQYPKRVVCSARSVPDLMIALNALGISADYLVGWSGAVVADGAGKTLWISGFSADQVERVAMSLPVEAHQIVVEGTTVQFVVPHAVDLHELTGLRVERYQGVTFVGPWQNSKLRAVCRLLRHLEWRGRIRAFGDGPYDRELLTYFDGTWIGQVDPSRGCARQSLEISYEIE